MRRVKLSERSLTPNIKLPIIWEWSWECTSPNFNHPGKWEFFYKSGQSAASWRSSCAQLTFKIRAHCIHFALLGQDKSVFFSAWRFNNFVWNPVNVIWCQFVCALPDTKLTLLSSTTCKKSTDVVNKSTMLFTCCHFFYVRFVVVIKIDESWSIDNS